MRWNETRRLSKKPDGSFLLLTIGYILFRKLAERVLHRAKWVRLKLDAAGIRISPTVYISAMMFWTMVTPILVFVTVPLLIDLKSLNAILSTLLSVELFLDPWMYHLLLTLVSAVIVAATFYCYPLYIAGKIKREIERNLVYITNYISIMASGEATPEETFASLAKIGKVFGIQQSGMSVVRSIDLLGQDIISALDQESKRTPSAEYGLFLQGFIATFKKGGDLKAYLAAMSEKQVDDRKRLLTKLITQLNFVAEVFIIGIVAFPVIMIILLTVMESLGGSVLGDLSGIQIMMLMTYLLVPVAAVGVVILTDIVMGEQ